MPDNNELYKSLGQVPELVKTAQNQSANIENLSKMVAELCKRQAKAYVPKEEHEKLAQTISHTPCAAPDMTEVAVDLSKAVMLEIRQDIHDETVRAVKDAVKDTPVTVTKEHVYKPSWEMSKIANETLARRFWIMFGITVLTTLSLVFGLFKYFNSDYYISSQYEDICKSKYLTEEERKMLVGETCYFGLIPKEFHNSPDLVKAKMKRNKEILQQRKTEARANKGKFSTKVPLER